MTNVLFLGDTHGDRGFTLSVIRWAAANDIDRIVQLGDFGFYPRVSNGQRFLHDVGKESVQAHVPLYFIDGNHEDHDYLDGLRARKSNNGFYNYGKYPVTYIDRGTRWEWGGVWFGAFGGACSIDRDRRDLRSPRYGYFPQEMPDETKIESLGKVDVLLTHDSPIIPPSVYGTGYKHDEVSRQSQSTVYKALVSTEASLLLHGHWHLNERYGVHGATVQALDMNYNGLHNAGAVFRTDDRRLFSMLAWEYRDE